MGENRNAYSVVVRNPEKTTGKTRHRSKDNIKIDLTERVWEAS